MDEPQEIAEVRDALNRHGVFLKKGILSELSRIPGLDILGEEIGTTFGETRVADIVTTEQFLNRTQELRLVFECKRVDPEKRWIFFPHTERRHRISRSADVGVIQSDFYGPLPTNYFVCSEGYEFPSKSKSENPVANQDPVFKAASQLAASFLGLVQSALRGRNVSGLQTKLLFAPILATTARLFVAKHKWDEVPLTSGRIEAGGLQLIECEHLVLKHPFPTPQGFDDSDFRERFNDPWSQIHTESIYVVRATALKAFLTLDKREFMAQV